MIRGALFDLDGTLADTSADLIAAANATLEDMGADGRLDPALDAGTSGRGGRAMLRLGLARSARAWDDADVEAAVPGFLQAYESRIAVHSRLFPHAEAALDALAAEGWRLAICTNKPERLARILLEELGVLARFAGLVGADTLPVRKPDPRPVWEAAARAGADRAACVFVGDTVTDREAARAADMPCVLLDLGLSADAPRSLAPEAIAPDWRAVPALCGSLRPRRPAPS